jgi:CRP-like cAMP-binding protein
MNKGLLNALSESVETYVFSPEDLILVANTRISGIYLISTGQVEVLSSLGEVIDVLSSGQSFGEKALTEAFISEDGYRSKSFTEILYIRGSTYRHISTLYQERDERDTASVKRMGHSESVRFIRPKNPETTKKSIFSDPSLANLFGLSCMYKLWKNLTLGMMIPESYFRSIWDNCVFFGLLFYLTSIALLLAGTFHSTFSSDFLELLVIGYLVDVFFCIDMILHATSFAFVSEGVIIDDLQSILKYFLSNNNIVYIALWLIPFDAIFGFGINLKLLPTFRLLKLLHMHRFQRLSDEFLNTIAVLLNIVISFELARFLSLYLLLFELCHWAGCIWMLAADLSTEIFGFEENWKVLDKSPTSSINYNSFYGVQYTRSIYWAASTMSSIGFPDILPVNPVEDVVVMFVMFFGYLVFNTLLGAIATLIGSFDREKREFNAKVEKIRNLMNYTLVPSTIETRTLQYFEYLWTRYEGIDEMQVLQGLPKTLRSDVVHHVLGPQISLVPFFKDCSEPIEHFLLELFEPRVYLDGDAIMVAGDMGREMFIIEKGYAAVTSADKRTIYAKLKAGDYAGESSLLESKPRLASVFAIGYVDTYFITSENFNKVRKRCTFRLKANLRSTIWLSLGGREVPKRI